MSDAWYPDGEAPPVIADPVRRDPTLSIEREVTGPGGGYRIETRTAGRQERLPADRRSGRRRDRRHRTADRVRLAGRRHLPCDHAGMAAMAVTWNAETVARFWAKVDRRGEDECWPWAGAIKDNGYGVFHPDGRRNSPRRGKLAKAHRFAYELSEGPIPDGHDLDHECHNRDTSCAGGHSCRHRRCCNPRHLEPRKRRDNLRRGRGLAKAWETRRHRYGTKGHS